MNILSKLFCFLILLVYILFAPQHAQAQGRSAQNFATGEVSIIDITNNGRAWVGTPQSGCGLYAGGAWTTFDSTNTPMQSNNIKAICLYNIGTVLHSFMGTDKGLAYKHGTTWDSLVSLPNMHVTGIVKSLNDSLWVSTSAGISLYSGSTLQHLADYNMSNSSLPVNNITCMQSNRSASPGYAAGTSGNGFFYTLDGSSFTHKTVANGGLINDSVNCIYVQTGGGTYYIGTKAGLSVWSSSFSNYTTANGLPDNDITTLTKDCQNRLWIGTRDHGLSIYNGTSFFNISTSNGLSTNKITSIHCDTACSCWVGTRDNGIIVIDSSLTQFTAVNLPTDIADLTADASPRIYPQPATARVTFSVLPSAGSQISLSDMDGRVVLSQTASAAQHTIYLDGLQSGLYIYSISAANAPTYRGKLLIAK